MIRLALAAPSIVALLFFPWQIFVIIFAISVIAAFFINRSLDRGSDSHAYRN